MKKAFTRFAVGFTVFWLAVVVVVSVAALFRAPLRGNSILSIRLDGELAERETPRLATLFGDDEAVTLRGLTESIRAAANDTRIKGLVLQVQTPVVSVAALTEIEEAMHVFRRSGKWSVGYLETAGELSSGDSALALASTANEVVLAPSGEINLAGMQVVVPFFKGTLDKLKITPFAAKRGQFKTAPNSYTETGFTSAQRESLAMLVNDLAAVVVDHLAARRHVDVETVTRWMGDAPLTAEMALHRGVVDRLGYWDSVVASAEAAAERKDCFVPLSAYVGLRALHREGPRVAVITGSGEIHRGRSSFGIGSSPDMGADTVAGAFRQARAAEVVGIVFRVDSPGGSYVASDLIRREIELCRAAKIPVVVSMGAYAASGGYMVTLGANRVVASPGTVTGSIGVYATSFATRRFWQDFLGVSFDSYRTAPNAVNLSLLDAPSMRERAAIEAMLDRIYDDFVGKVAVARGKTRAQIHANAEGRVWSGKAALARGLVDDLGGFEVALARLKEIAGVAAASDVSVVDLPEPEGPLAVMQELLGGSTVSRYVPVELRQAEKLAEGVLRHTDHVLTLPLGMEIVY